MNNIPAVIHVREKVPLFGMTHWQDTPRQANMEALLPKV